MTIWERDAESVKAGRTPYLDALDDAILFLPWGAEVRVRLWGSL